MKKILIVSCGLLCATVSNAQYIQDYIQNTLVSNNLEIASLFSATSPEGNLFSFYLEDQSFKLQILDVDGNKLLDPNGLVLENNLVLNNGFTGIAHESQIVFDANENAIIVHEHQDGIKIKKISSTGAILGSTTLTRGYIPKIEKLSETDIIVGYYDYDQSDMNSETSSIKRLHWNGTLFETVWSKSFDYQIENMKLNGNHEVYIVSYDVLPSPPYVYVKANLMDQSNGNLIWDNWISCSTYTALGLYSERLSTDVDDQNNLYIVKSYINGFSHKAYAQKVDPSGVTIWGTNGISLMDGIDNLLINTQVYCFYENSSDQLKVFINGDNNDDALQIYFVNITPGISDFSSEVTLLVPDTVNAYLFGVQKCGEDFILGYLSKVQNNIYAKKINQLGQNVWSESALLLNSTTSVKIPIDNIKLNREVDQQLVITFLDERGGQNKGYAQNLICDGYSDASVDEHVFDKYIVYPNPTMDHLNFSFNEKVLMIEISTMEGKIVQQEKVNNSSYQVKVSDLEDGIYLYSIINEKGIRSTGKFIKE